MLTTSHIQAPETFGCDTSGLRRAGAATGADLRHPISKPALVEAAKAVLSD